jgi:hypothetical protein
MSLKATVGFAGVPAGLPTKLLVTEISPVESSVNTDANVNCDPEKA